MSIKFDIRSAAASILAARSAEKQAATEKKEQRLSANRAKILLNSWNNFQLVSKGGLEPWTAMAIPQIFCPQLAPTSCEISCDLPGYVPMAKLERQLKDKVLVMEGRKIWEKAEADRQLAETLADNDAIIHYSQEAVDGIKALKAEAIKAKAFAEQVDRHLLATASQVNVSNSVTEAIKESLLTEYADELEELNNLLADW